MTPFIKKKDIKNNWYLVNAKDLVVGRLAAYISVVLRGNIEKLKFTGKKFENKKYYKHTGYPGGIKSINPKNLMEKNKSQDILKFAVKRMLPGGPLAKKQLSKLKMYYGDKHPHETQNPVEINFSEINKKNHIKP